MFTGFLVNPYTFVAILTLSLVLIVLEIFVPSFGILGIVGGYLFIESIISIRNFINPIPYILIALILAVIIIAIIVKVFYKNMGKNIFVLNTDLKKSKGHGQQDLFTSLIGRQAVVNKTLRPSGEVEIDGMIYEAVSFGNYISKGQKVVVTKTKGSLLYVK